MAWMICDNFQFNGIWHRWSHVLCWRLAESDINVTPTVTCVDYVGDTIMGLL